MAGWVGWSKAVVFPMFCMRKRSKVRFSNVLKDRFERFEVDFEWIFIGC